MHGQRSDAYIVQAYNASKIISILKEDFIR